MIKRILIGAVLTFLMVFALSELFLPFLVAQQIEAGLSKSFGTQDIHAKVKARPAMAMLGGTFSTITVDGKNIKTDKLTIGQFSAVFTNTTIDLPKLTNERTLMFRSIGSFDGTIILNEQELNDFVAQSVKGVKNVKVVLQPDVMKVTGDLGLGPTVVGIAMEGKLRGDQTQLKFITERFFVNNAVVSTNFAGNALTEFLLFDMKKLPIAAAIRDVILEEGRVVIRIARDQK
jgi:hypothetical protein